MKLELSQKSIKQFLTSKVWSQKFDLKFFSTLVLCAGLTIGLWSAAFSAWKGSPPSTSVFLIACAFCCYFPLLLLLKHLTPNQSLFLTVIVASLSGIVLMFAPPTLSDDIYRYAWDGHVFTQGINPYNFPPNHAALEQIRIPLWEKVSYPHIATIYPPIAQLFFGFCAFVHQGIFTIKFFLFLSHLGTIFVLSKLKFAKKNYAALIYGINPLVLVETCFSGHIDALLAFALSLALLAFQKNKTGLAVLLSGVISHIKLIGIFFAPVLAKEKKSAAFLCVGLFLIALIPTAFYPEKSTAGLGHYSQRWEGNASGYYLFKSASNWTLKNLHTGENICIPNWGKWTKKLTNTAFNPAIGQGSTIDSNAEQICLDKKYVASMLARFLVMIATITITIFSAKKLPTLPALRIIFWSILLFSPQVHPWYLLWLLPIELANQKWSALIWSALILLSYHPLDQWVTNQTWIQNPALWLLQYFPLFSLLMFEFYSFRKENATQTQLHQI